MSEILTVAVNAAVNSPMDFVMGPMILPVFVLLTFTVGTAAWKIAGLIEAKFNK